MSQNVATSRKHCDALVSTTATIHTKTKHTYELCFSSPLCFVASDASALYIITYLNMNADSSKCMQTEEEIVLYALIETGLIQIHCMRKNVFKFNGH